MDPTLPVPVPETDERRDENANLIQRHMKMVKSIRGWGTWLLVLGVIQLIATSLFEPTFGILILIVGALSFIFIHPALFILYGTTLAWAAISNLLAAATGGQAQWGIFALVQLYLAYTTLREYRLHRRNEESYQEMLKAEGAVEKGRSPDPVFPIGGCALSFVGALLMAGLFLMLVILAVQEKEMNQTWAPWVLGLSQGFAVLAIGLSAASLASRFRYRILSILATAGAGLTVLLFIVLSLG